jgi:diaminopimelate decarboxylase
MQAFPNAYGLTERYSLKAGASGAIIKIFDRMGLHFDASSMWEAMRALAVGVEPAKISLTVQAMPSNLDELIGRGVQFTACSLLQLTQYGERFPGAEVAIRINPGEGTGFINRLTSGGPRSSFGIWFEYIDQALHLLDKYKLRINRIHQHIGSGHDPHEWARISVRTLELSKAFGPVPIVNLGGGYRVKALSSDAEVSYDDIGEQLRLAFLQFGKETGCNRHLELEPGTFLTANCGSLITTVVDTMSTGKNGYNFIKVDSGLTEVIRPGFYGSPHPLVTIPAQGALRSKTKQYLVAGHCCIAGDVLTVELRNPEQVLPQELAVAEAGDFLVVERAGGYCSSMNMKNFNSFPEAPEVLHRADGSFTLIRRRQTLEQLIQNEIIPRDLT